MAGRPEAHRAAPADAVDAIKACAGPLRTLTALAARDTPRDDAEFARAVDDLAATGLAPRTALRALPKSK
ncbi:hypothetical protein ACWDA7_11770 [Streptomyces sp. NPDC001156]